MTCPKRINRTALRTARIAGSVGSIAVAVITLYLPPLRVVAAQEIVVNRAAHDQSLDTVLSESGLRAIFGMRLRTWPDGSPIRVYVLPDRHPLHTQFCKRLLGVFPHQMRSAWDRLVYSGTGQAPLEVSSEEEMRAKIASTPGAIGYLKTVSIDEPGKDARPAGTEIH